MNRTLQMAILIAKASSCVAAAEMPIWDLAKNEIPVALQSGKIDRVGSEIILRDGAAFAARRTPSPIKRTSPSRSLHPSLSWGRSDRQNPDWHVRRTADEDLPVG